MIFASVVSAETLTAGKAYIVSSINVNASQTIQSGQSYSLVPQVIVATGNENYVGSVSTFTGCFNGKRYEAGVEKGNCLTSVVNNLTSTSTTDALSAAQGKILNDKIADTYTKSEVDAKIASSGVNKDDILELVYPVGSIYMSASNVSPSTFLGGEWTALDEGRVLIGANSTYTAGSKGGEASHTLTTNEMPTHSHSGSTNTTGAHNHGTPFRWSEGSGGVQNISAGYEWGGAYGYSPSTTNGDHSHSFTTNNAGGGQAHNNMQPYLAVYMWQRTA